MSYDNVVEEKSLKAAKVLVIAGANRCCQISDNFYQILEGG